MLVAGIDEAFRGTVDETEKTKNPIHTALLPILCAAVARAPPAAAVAVMGTGQSKVNDDLVLLEDDGNIVVGLRSCRYT